MILKPACKYIRRGIYPFTQHRNQPHHDDSMTEIKFGLDSLHGGTCGWHGMALHFLPNCFPLSLSRMH